MLLLAGLIYGTRLSETPPGGEEPRRGQVAREMFRSGDWIVPRQQGLPFLSRPPVQNWAIALCSLARGKIDAVAIRFPSVMAILLTVTLIYAYGRTFLARLGAMSAMAAFATMGLVLQFGWLGETEALYTFVVAASLIVWRWANARHKPPLWGWCGGYGLAALGMLTKGPQAPAYFLGGVAAFLLAMRRGRELFRWQHAVGVGLFFAIWLAWEIPFYLRVGPVDAWTMFAGDIGMRFQDGSWIRTMRHFVEFPLSVAACTLPWGVLLLAYVQRDFRRGIAFAREDAWFLGLSIGVASLSCYLVPGARNRYLAPVLPLAALLIGLAAQQCYAAGASDWLVRLRRHFFIGMGLLAAGLGTWIVAATVLRMGPARPAAGVLRNCLCPGRRGHGSHRLLGFDPAGALVAAARHLGGRRAAGPGLLRCDHQHLRRHAAPHRCRGSHRRRTRAGRRGTSEHRSGGRCLPLLLRQTDQAASGGRGRGPSGAGLDLFLYGLRFVPAGGRHALREARRGLGRGRLQRSAARCGDHRPATAGSDRRTAEK